MLKKNEGQVDRVVRVIAGIIVAFVGYYSLSGISQTIAYIVGAALIITGAIGFCGLYALLGISTCPVKKPKK